MRRAVVVGGGILGTWHAIELRRLGFAVDHLEADAGPTGASVRNFGLVWVSGRRTGAELEVATWARHRWAEMAGDAPGIGFRADGSLTVAMTDGERKVMEEFSHLPDASARGITFLEPEAVRAANPAVAGAVTGALHCALDAVVEPRRALGVLREHLVSGGHYAFHPGCRVVDLEAQAVIDVTGRRWPADLVVVATGAAYDHLPGTEAVAAGLRRVRLQMLETAPFAARLSTALADADSLRYYPAYDSVSLDLLGAQNEVSAAHHLQLLLVQRADGGLTIGDTHAYGEPFDFALSEDPTHELLARAARLLGTDLPAVSRRWEGVYSQCLDGAVCARAEVRPGVWLVTGPGGRGMTCAPAIAADTLALAGGGIVIGRYALVCLDMAGTTVRDDGVVDAAFTAALGVVGVDLDSPRLTAAHDYVLETMGQSKADVFAALLDPDDAARATEEFALAYESMVGQGRVRAMPGATDLFAALRAAGVAVCLTTGFAPSTRNALIGSLGWADLIDLALSPADVGRGRPEPDMIFGAMDRLDVRDPLRVAVVGDTTSDLEAGTKAGAGAVVGVLSGAHDRATLEAAPHTDLLDDITGLVALLERDPA